MPVTVERDAARLRPSETPVLAGDPSRLRAATGWQPEIPLERPSLDALEAARAPELIGSVSSRRALITGITGQDGSYLAELLLEKGYEVFGMTRRASTENVERIAHLTDRVTLASGRPARPVLARRGAPRVAAA